MVCYSSTRSWYIIKNNGTAFSAAATKILGLEGGNTQEFKTLSLSLGQKGYNSLSFWKKNNFFKKSFNFSRVPQVSKRWFFQTCLTEICQHCSKAFPLAEILLLGFAPLLQSRRMFFQSGSAWSGLLRLAQGDLNYHQKIVWRGTYMFHMPFHYNISGDL